MSVQERSERIMKLLYSFNRKKQIENIKEVITSTLKVVVSMSVKLLDAFNQT